MPNKKYKSNISAWGRKKTATRTQRTRKAVLVLEPGRRRYRKIDNSSHRDGTGAFRQGLKNIF